MCGSVGEDGKHSGFSLRRLVLHMTVQTTAGPFDGLREWSGLITPLQILRTTFIHLNRRFVWIPVVSSSASRHAGMPPDLAPI